MVPDLEMNSAGFAGSGLDGGTLDHFDNTEEARFSITAMI